MKPLPTALTALPPPADIFNGMMLWGSSRAIEKNLALYERSYDIIDQKEYFEKLDMIDAAD